MDLRKNKQNKKKSTCRSCSVLEKGLLAAGFFLFCIVVGIYGITDKVNEFLLFSSVCTTAAGMVAGAAKAYREIGRENGRKP